MKKLFAVLLVLTSSLAQADIEKLANLNVVCTEKGSSQPRVITVVSWQKVPSLLLTEQRIRVSNSRAEPKAGIRICKQ